MQHLDFDTLNSMRLKDLQSTYETVVGEPTRCPNKTFLIRKIGEKLRAQEGEEPIALAEEDVHQSLRRRGTEAILEEFFLVVAAGLKRQRARLFDGIDRRQRAFRRRTSG